MSYPLSSTLFGVCSSCGFYTVIFHQYVLPRSGRVMVAYCYSCFGGY